MLHRKIRRFSFRPNRPVLKLITDKVPTADIKSSIGDVEKLLLKKIDFFESINYVYILDDCNHLVGVISVKELFRKKKTTPIKSVMTKKVIAVRPYHDQEKAAYVTMRENIKAMPVVNDQNEFLGVVESDQIINIIYRENHEDLLRLAGISHKANEYDDVMKTPIWRSLKHRLPWLVLGLFGGLGAAGIVDGFERVLAQNIILASFIPLIVYMADAVGTQMEAFIIRDFAINPKIKFLPYLLRQLLIVFMIGLVVSSAGFLAVILFYKNIVVAMVLALALLSAIVSSVFTGSIIPYIFTRLKFDPANVSGPIATILQDLSSVLIYFLVASLLL